MQQTPKYFDVRENPANEGLEVSYVSDNDIDTLCDFYVGALNDAKDLSTQETSDRYMISAKMDGVGYTIMLSRDAMNSNPSYAGKRSVYIILTGLEGISSGTQIPEGEEIRLYTLNGGQIFAGNNVIATGDGSTGALAESGGHINGRECVLGALYGAFADGADSEIKIDSDCYGVGAGSIGALKQKKELTEPPTTLSRVI